MSFRLSILLSLLIVSSCGSLQNKTETTAMHCGIAKEAIGDRQFIKILSPDGSEFDASDIKTLKAVASVQKTEATQTIPLTSRGCLMVSNETDIIQIINTATGDSLTKKIDSAWFQSGLRQVRLIKKSELKVSLACPDEGLFADQSLKNPLFVSLTGDTAGLDIRLDAFANDGNPIGTLARKSMGDDRLALSDNLSVAGFQQGSYLLKVYGHHVSEGLENQPRLLTSEKTCQLHILRGAIQVGGFAKTDVPLVFPPHTELPWHVDDSSEKMLVCVEPHQAKTSNECLPQASCADPKNFKEAKKASSGEPGINDFYVYAENKAGAKSPLACQTLVTSPTAPALQVTWDHADLQTPGAVLRKPYPVLKANLETSHGLLDQAIVENTLTCKVEFEIKGKSQFADKSVTCLEGRCTGQSMADFVPCDKHLSFSIIESLNQTVLLSSRLILKVRANDKAGHQTEAEKSVWINQTVWDREFMELKIGPQPMSIGNYIVDKNEDVIASFSGAKMQGLFLWVDDSWTALKLEADSCNCSFDLTKSPNGEIIVNRMELLGNNAVTQTVYRYRDRQLEQLTSDDDPSKIVQCKVLAKSQDDMYCAGNMGNIFRLQGQHWQKLPPALEEDISADLARWRLMANGNLIGVRKNTLTIWDGGAWKVLTLPIPDSIYSDVIEDFQGQPWLIVSDTLSNIKLSRIEGDHLIDYAPATPIRGDAQLVPTPYQFQDAAGLGSLVIGFNKFDFSTMQWSILDMPGDTSKGYGTTSRTNKNFVSYASRGFLEDAPTPLYWPIQAMGYRCQYLCIGTERSANYLFFKSFDKATTTHTLIRLKTRRSASFNSQMLDILDVRNNGSWVDEQGVHLSFADGTVLTPLADRFAFDKAPSGRDVLQITRLSQGSFCVSRGSGLYVYQDGKETPLKAGAAGHNQSCVEDKEGHLWWTDPFDHQLLTYRDGKPIPVKGVGRSVDEEIAPTLFKYDSWIGIRTNKRIVFFKPDQSIAGEFPLNHFGDDSKQFLSVAFFSENELVVRLQRQDQKNVIFIMNPRTGIFVRDLALEDIVGNTSTFNASFMGPYAYVMTYKPDAYMIRRDQGRWKVMATFDDIRPYVINKKVPPNYYSVDTLNRVWVLTTEPTNFIRLDTDL